MRLARVALVLVPTLTVLTACVPALPASGARFPMSSEPWRWTTSTGTERHYAAPIEDLLVRCYDHSENLREEAQDSMEVAEWRRVLVDLGSAVVGGTSIPLFASASSATDGESVGGYITAGTSVIAQIINVIIPGERVTERVAAWRRARSIYAAVYRRLTDMDTCANNPPEPGAAEDPVCTSLAATITIPAGAAVAATGADDETPPPEVLRLRRLGGGAGIRAVREALQECLDVSSAFVQ